MPTPTIPRQFVTVDGLTTAHAVFGEQGTPVIMLHGWGASVDLVAPLATRLANQGFHCFALDLPGFGQSVPPPETWGTNDYANFVTHYMMLLNIDKAHFFGHSFGGRLCLVIGAEHADKVDKIVLADSAGVPPRRSTSSQLRLSAYKAIRNALYGMGAGGLADRLRDAYTRRYGSADYKSAGVLRATFVRVVNENLLPYAAQVRASTLLIWGAKDDDTPLWQGQTLEKTIPDAGLVVYEDAGHYSYLDRLNDAARTIVYFFTH
ncbi:MAG: alpha/beta hydrolase [Anaerolineae bacterium]|nr:alpha/beta hydrolase [Anaerolineae bacterium]